jgi:hypothetical protein
MIRKTLMALALVAGITLAQGAAAGPFFGRPTPPTAAELGLNTEATGEWQAIQADAQALRSRTLKTVEAELGDAKETLATSNPDLRSVGLEFQSIALGFLMEQRQIRDRRLAFYNSLTPDQQLQVREFMIEQIERAERAIHAFEVLQGE